MNNQKKDLLTINVASIVLSLSSVVAKLSQISSVAFILGRSMVVLPFFMLICYIFKLFHPIISRWHLLLIVVSGLLMGFHWSLFYESVKVSSIVVGVVTVHTYPLISAILEPLFFKQRLSFRQLLESGLVIVGIYIMSLGSVATGMLGLGIFFGLASAFLLALRNIVTKQLVDCYSPILIMFFQVIISIFCLLPFGMTSLMQADGYHWQLIVVTGLVISGVGHTCYVKSMQHLAATTVGIVASFQIVYAAIYAYLFFGTIPQIYIIIGSLIILVAVSAEQWVLFSKKDEQDTI